MSVVKEKRGLSVPSFLSESFYCGKIKEFFPVKQVAVDILCLDRAAVRLFYVKIAALTNSGQFTLTPDSSVFVRLFMQPLAKRMHSAPHPIRQAWRFVLLALNLLAGAYTLLVYWFADTSPATFGPAGFLTLSLPVMLVVHGVFEVYWLWRLRWWALFSLTILLLGLPYWQRTLSFHRATQAPDGAGSFKVLSYNVRMLNTYAKELGVSPATSTRMLDWVINSDADIKCIQELYDDNTSTVFNSMKQLKRRQKYQQYATSSPDLYESKQGYVGVVIFSRFPIIRHQKLKLDQSGINKGVFADIVISKDTIRVFNVHLQSMSIRVRKVLNEKEYEGAKKSLADIIRRLKRGFVSRAGQVAILERHIANSPYKVIVCGDLNDMPYSYTYSTLRKRLHNAFEEAGTGFGFTYNDRLFFLRIDNQFCDQRLKIRDFATLRDITYSDHFPISATYSFKQMK